VRRAEVALGERQPEVARSLLTATLAGQIEETPRLEPRGGAQVEAWLLLALIEAGGGEHDAAARALDTALELAEQERIYGPFLAGGPSVQELLERHARNRTEHPALLEVVLDGRGDPLHHGQQTMLACPLTDREMNILRYLPTMLSNAEIGAETFVSLNTVKTHLRSIYRKLEASNRADAVARARRIGLLPQGIRRPRSAPRH